MSGLQSNGYALGSSCSIAWDGGVPPHIPRPQWQLCLSRTESTVHVYDPLVEFLELGVTVDGKTAWKVVRAGLEWCYGGMNGTGGFEAVADSFLVHPDHRRARGNILGGVTEMESR